MALEVEGVRPRGRPKKTWSVVVEKKLPALSFMQGRTMWTHVM